jgi:hypothetical protein
VSGGPNYVRLRRHIRSAIVGFILLVRGAAAVSMRSLSEAMVEASVAGRVSRRGTATSGMEPNPRIPRSLKTTGGHYGNRLRANDPPRSTLYWQ